MENNITDIIVIILVLTVFAAYFIIGHAVEKKKIKKYKDLLKPGRKVIFYHCINEELNSWKKVYEYQIVANKDAYFQCINTSNDQLCYYKYTDFGIYADKYEIYDGEKLIYENGFVAEEKNYN